MSSISAARPTIDRERLRGAVAEIVDVPLEELTDGARFVDDLGVDSLIALEVVIRLERLYAVKLDETRLAELTCLDAVHDMIVAGLANQAAGDDR